MLDWYGERCPSFQEMEEVALDIGVQVAFHVDFDVPRFFWDENGDPWVIAIPEQFGPLARCWAIAHELGHLISHGDPPLSPSHHQEQESEADAWAARAMLPDDAVRVCEGNVHDLVNWLRNEYQEFTNLKEDRIRALAYRIAFTRIKGLEEVA